MKRVTLAAICTCLSVCALAYTITKEQFVTMLKNANPKTVRIGGVAHGEYKSNGVDFIDCYNKKGVLRKIANSPSIEVRITNKRGRRRVYYFDTILLQDSATIVGCESRLLYISKTMKLDDIELIEMEDGGKNYYYIE